MTLLSTSSRVSAVEVVSYDKSSVIFINLTYSDSKNEFII